MMEIEAMTDAEVMAELQRLQSRFTEKDFDLLENLLCIQAGCLCWTGDPLKQPARSVLVCVRMVLKEKEHNAFPKGRWTK